MKREQLRLASFIISIITINSLILHSFTNGPGKMLIHLITLSFVIIAEYLLTKQTIESSSQRISLFTQLGAQTKSITSVIIARFLFLCANKLAILNITLLKNITQNLSGIVLIIFS